MTNQQIQISYKMPVTLKKEGKYVIASIEPFDVHSQGLNEEEAIKNVSEAFTMFVVSCMERGTMDRVLHDCGFRPNGNNVQGRTPATRIVDIPIPLVSDRAQAHAC